MDDIRLGQLFRAARIRRSWRQCDVALRAGVSQQTVSRLERGMVGACRVEDVRRIASILEIQLEFHARWRGGEGARLVSAQHSAMAEDASNRLPRFGWVVRPEVSFSIWGERGVIDLLAWHPQHAALLVVELKTELVDVGEMLGTLDRKRRLATEVARDYGWTPRSVSACVLLLESRTNRRHVAQHAAVLHAALPVDGRALRGWLAHPTEAIAALAFLPKPRSVSTRPGSGGLRRVRTANRRSPRAQPIRERAAPGPPGADLVPTGGRNRA